MQIVIKLSEQHTIAFQGEVIFKEIKSIGCASIEVTGYELHEVKEGFSLGVREITPCYERTEMFHFENLGRFMIGTQAMLNILAEIPTKKDAQFMSCEHCGWRGPTQ